MTLFKRVSFFFGMVSAASVASVASITSSEQLPEGLRKMHALEQALGKIFAERYPDAEIEFDLDEVPNLEERLATLSDQVAVKPEVLQETGHGTMHFRLGQGRTLEAAYRVYQKAYVTKGKIAPGERIEASRLQKTSVDLARGEGFTYRGAIVSANRPLGALEAKQTLLEGQTLLSTAVTRVPDGRRGDAVKVEVLSGGLILSTQATLSEPAYLNESVHVVTTKSKRELVGSLVAPGKVEVKL